VTAATSNLPLFMEPTPAHNGTRTSVDAAHAIKPHVAAQRSRVLALLAGRDGMTAQEIEDALSLSGSSVRPRIVELRESGCVRDSGRTRKSASGRACVVWEFVR
jgi:predicted ArsR family transcriptional regulator